MRPTSLLPGALMGALLVWAAAMPVVGQVAEPAQTPRPDPFKNAQIAVIANEAEDPTVNSTIFDAARIAADEGLQTKRPPWEGTLPEPNVLIAAHDWAEEDF